LNYRAGVKYEVRSHKSEVKLEVRSTKEISMIDGTVTLLTSHVLLLTPHVLPNSVAKVNNSSEISVMGDDHFSKHESLRVNIDPHANNIRLAVNFDASDIR